MTVAVVAAAVFLVAGSGLVIYPAHAAATDIEQSTQKMQHLSGMLYSVSAISTQCSNQIKMGNYDIIDSCANLMDSLDKHITEAFAETEAERTAVLGTLY